MIWYGMPLIAPYIICLLRIISISRLSFIGILSLGADGVVFHALAVEETTH